MCLKAMAKPIICLVILLSFILPSKLILADITTSNVTFAEAVQAVKDKNYQHAVNLFELQAFAAQHDAQYNLALLLQSGKGRPQNYQQALFWAWSAFLGGIEPAQELSEDLKNLLPEDSLKVTREKLIETLQDRIDAGDRSALMELALFYKEISEEPNFEEAYLWYSIASAFLLEGAIFERDEAAGKVETKSMVELQERAGTIFEKLSSVK
ncbi:hypothetical protein OA085_00865 [Alphaproteobacteria bacterium]|nr:hypothetical protein [Alphaproteobacteria bacterium]